ncbi:surfactant protein B [Oesophagostomum dentatum]|uniref:Surfactant protein B n=1 Tax=Oesophagostomum dentatum TaxID=61180 RepID=A0A0B1T2D3_OESDE|nr:surfactant protein B [Oesophagostomum dentatum]
MQQIISYLILFSVLSMCLGKGLECAVCLQFVEGIDKKEIEEDQNLKKKAEHDCRQILDMPVIDDYCIKLVDKEFDTITQMIMNDEKPSTICKKIEMC